MVTAVITSFDRWDLLKRTIDSFNRVNTYPIKDFIIIDDSGNIGIHNKIRETYPYTLIPNQMNIGLVESIDKAYSSVMTPYIWHSEDDFEYIKPGFIEKCIKVMESDDMICRVGIRGTAHIKSLRTEYLLAEDIPYKLPLEWEGHPWHGFGFQCGLIRKSAYDKVKPYNKLSEPGRFITERECLIGIAYHDLGYKAVSLIEDYAIHTGGKRSTYGLKMEG